MKFLKFKKVLCTAVSLALLISALPATIASAELLDDTVVTPFYQNDFTDAMDITNLVTSDYGKDQAATLGYIPSDTEKTNQVLKLESQGYALTSETSNTQFNFNMAPSKTNNTGVTFNDKGYDSTKPIIYEMKMYIPEASIRGANGENYTGYYGIRIGPHISSGKATDNKRNITHVFYKIGINAQKNSADVGKGYFAVGEDIKGGVHDSKMTTDAWHTFKWVIAAGGETISIWMDDIQLYTNKSSHLDLTGTKALGYRYFEGIKVAGSYKSTTDYTNIPKGEAIYVDDVKIYQVKEGFSGQFSFNAVDSVGTLTLNHAITNADLDKITVADSLGVAVTPSKSLSTDGKVVTLSFGDSLKSEAAYTVNASNLADEFGQTLSISTFSFTAPKKAVSYLFQNDYSSEKNVDEKEAGITDLAFDPEDESNKVLKVTASGNAITWGTGFNVGLYGGTDTFTQRGYQSGKPVIYEMKMYVTDDFVQNNTLGDYSVLIGPAVGTYTKNIMYNAGLNDLKNKTKVESGSVYIAADKWNPLKTITTDAWHTFKWIADGSTVSMWVDGSAVYANMVNENGSKYTTFKGSDKMNGIRIVGRDDSDLAAGSTLYVDDVKVYQVADVFALTEATYDISEGSILVSTGSQPTQATIDAITVKNGDTDISSLITSRVWDSTNNVLKLYVPFESLQLGTDYTVVLPKNSADLYGQMTSVAQEATFTTPMSRSVALKTATVTAAPSDTGAAASIVLENGAASRSAWVVMAVYGQYNELLGVDAQTITVDGTTEPIPFTIIDDCSDATIAKVFIWDSQNSMIPLQNSSIIWTAGN